MVSWFSNGLIKNSEKKLTMFTSVAESTLHFSKQKNIRVRHLSEKKSILQKFYLVNSRNHNSINKIIEDN